MTPLSWNQFLDLVALALILGAGIGAVQAWFDIRKRKRERAAKQTVR